MKKRTLIIATRKSPLALWQAEHVGKLISQRWSDVDYQLLPMQTSGDRFLKDKLQALGGKGLFVKELEEALLDGRADLAVHSMKDVPSELPSGLCIAATPQRDDPHDALVSPYSTTIKDLPHKALIGTSSLRRQAQLLAIRPDLRITPLRGNIHTRLQKMKAEKFDAIILAAAGLKRMGLEQQIQETIAANILLPACGQGVLGIECRQEDSFLFDLLQPLNCQQTKICVDIERKVNERLGGNCHVPLAVHCHFVHNTKLHLSARVLSLDGIKMIANEQIGDIMEKDTLAHNCAEQLLKNGAKELLYAI